MTLKENKPPAQAVDEDLSRYNSTKSQSPGHFFNHFKFWTNDVILKSSVFRMSLTLLGFTVAL